MVPRVFLDWVFNVLWQAQGKPHVLVVQSRVAVAGGRLQWFYFAAQILWQAQRCGHGGGLRRSDVVAGAVNRELWTGAFRI